MTSASGYRLLTPRLDLPVMTFLLDRYRLAWRRHPNRQQVHQMVDSNELSQSNLYGELLYGRQLIDLFSDVSTEGRTLPLLSLTLCSWLAEKLKGRLLG